VPRLTVSSSGQAGHGEETMKSSLSSEKHRDADLKSSIHKSRTTNNKLARRPMGLTEESFYTHLLKGTHTR